MNIVIVGIGKFGRELTRHLSHENHNITIIDTRSSVIEDVVNEYDVLGYCGNGASLDTLDEASAKKADLLIATTSTDETNILCCLVAKKLGIKQTIARIRNPHYAKQVQTMATELGVTMALNPDLDTAREIFRILRFPSALKVESFANGKVDLVEIKIEKESILNNHSLLELRSKYQVTILVCAVKRNNEVIIPNGDFKLKEGDYVYITAGSKELTQAFRKLNLFKNKLKSTMIVGGGKITYYLSNLLTEAGIDVKVIEADRVRCKELSQNLKDALIIQGDGTNQKLLLEEGVDKTDSIVTLTGMDETNIIISSFAKNINQNAKVITKVNNSNYDLILSNVGLDSIVSPKDIFSTHIIRYVRGMEKNRGSEFKTLYRLVGGKIEAVEFYIPSSTNYTSIPLKTLKIKKDYLLACIIREDKVIIPNGKDCLEPYDSVLIVTNKLVNDISDILE